MPITTKERPILFSGEMVRAILEGRKTQTRRVLKPQPQADNPTYKADLYRDGLDINWAFWLPDGRMSEPRTWSCPYGHPGDRLWVRETFSERMDLEQDASIERRRRYVTYAATSGHPSTEYHIHGPWKPSIFMPRWACRIELEIVKVRVERLQEITPPDVVAEGIVIPDQVSQKDHVMAHIGAWSAGWDKINGKRGFGWDANPWLWVIDFKHIT